MCNDSSKSASKHHRSVSPAVEEPHALQVQKTEEDTCCEEHAELASQQLIWQGLPCLGISDTQQLRSHAAACVLHWTSFFRLQASSGTFHVRRRYP